MDSKFSIAATITEDQKRMMAHMSVLVNVLGMQYIEIRQTNHRIKSVYGVMDCRYRMRQDREDKDTGNPANYKFEITGGELKFVANPWGIGNVAFLIDDDKPVPQNAKSGEKTGWNREFLASHYADGFFKIVDPQLDAEIRQRYENILRKLEEERPARAAFEKKARQASDLEGAKRRGINVVQLVNNETQGSSSGTVPVVEPKVDTEALDRVAKLEADNADLRKQIQSLLDMAKDKHAETVPAGQEDDGEKSNPEKQTFVSSADANAIADPLSVDDANVADEGKTTGKKTAKTKKARSDKEGFAE